MDPSVDFALSRIRVKDLRLRAYIGLNEDEQEKLQDVVVNLRIDYDALEAARSDQVERALDYKGVTKAIIALVDGQRFLLLERLVHQVLETVMAYPEVRDAEVEIDKPHALRFADSVSLSMAARRRPGLGRR